MNALAGPGTIVYDLPPLWRADVPVRGEAGGGSVQRLVGKKVWVIQYDDDDNSVIGIVEGVEGGFIALRMEHETDPTLYVNLTNVKEIEIFRERGEGELRLLRFPVDHDPANKN